MISWSQVGTILWTARRSLSEGGCPSTHARPVTQSFDGPRGPSNSLQQRQSSFGVIPPYRYVASTYPLCLPLLRKHRGCGVFFPFWDSTSAVLFDNSLQDSSPFFSHSCKLFCPIKKLISFPFKRFRTLSQHTGGGVPPTFPPSNLPTSESPVQSLRFHPGEK